LIVPNPEWEGRRATGSTVAPGVAGILEAQRTLTEMPIYGQTSSSDFHGSPYQEHVLGLSAGPYLDFPAVVSIETLSLCNAICDFCPYPGLERKGEVMPDSLIRKILDDLSSISERPEFQVNLSRVNEPFLDTRVIDISMDIERRFPEASSMFFSNATPLNEKNLLRLSMLQRVAFLNLSVNHHRDQEYERIMGLPFARTKTRLALINEMKSSGVLPFPIYVSRVGDGGSDDAAFLEWVRTTYPALSGLVTVRGDWLGAVPTQIGVAPDVGCRQWFQLHLLSNGRHAFCCIDSDGGHGTGDARHQHVIHEIYNHPQHRSLREELPSRRRVSTCSLCPMLP
jgi:hypothetical protein